MSDRLGRQLAFLAEADRLKSVLRANPLGDGSRRENSGEHSWHVALYALVLADQAGPEVRIDRVLRMLLIHDVVEIDCGDTPIHGDHDPAAVAQAEAAAADRLFGLLPPDQAAELRALWDEFEAGASPDAIFARSIDRVQPVMQNLQSGGGTWRDFSVTSEQLDARVGS
ncbi:HD domain-containing protein, partial [Rhodobacter sp. NSM]|uniref:HD domain-containing protein n=1 Tax=Rhodobacter sp. NSM TaxID=3457501 RepID=UPI003FD20F39